MEKKSKKAQWLLLIISLLVIGISSLISVEKSSRKVDYSEFLNKLSSETVESVTLKGDTLQYKVYGDTKTYITQYTNNIDLAKEISSHGTALNVKSDATSINWTTVIYIMAGLLMTTIIISFFATEKVKDREQTDDKKPGKKRQIIVDKSMGVSFTDVGGNEEAKESLREIIDFLENPNGYTKMGAKLPRGTLLVGPPGTGKTLLARAVAGEAKVPFIYMAGSDFVEMYIGLGAAKVRRMFEIAEKNAPCIIFIDEIDAIGKKRDSVAGGSGSDEREQTLNQLLSEMDGFNPSKGVVVLAATNRPDVLDEAIVRPGRFDRRIVVEKPDFKDRVSILTSYINKINSDGTIDIEQLAFATAGCTGADLANIVNEAAIKAVKDKKKAVDNTEMLEALDIILSGSCNHGIVLSELEKCIIATHEAAHALASIALDPDSSVNKISIIPRGKNSLGYTPNYKSDERFVAFKDEILTQIRVLLAGYCGEFVLLDNVSSSAAMDLQDATELAREMITKYGMSTEYGPVALNGELSDEMKYCIDKKTIEIIKYCYTETIEFIQNNSEILQDIATELAQREVLYNQELREILRGKQIEVPQFSPYKESPTLFIRPAANNSPEDTAKPIAQTKQTKTEQKDEEKVANTPVPKKDKKDKKEVAETPNPSAPAKKPQPASTSKVEKNEPPKKSVPVEEDIEPKDAAVEMDIPDIDVQEPDIKIPDDIDTSEIDTSSSGAESEENSDDMLPEPPKPKFKPTQKRNGTLSESDMKSKKAVENILNFSKKPRAKNTKPAKSSTPAPNANDELTEDDY